MYSFMYSQKIRFLRGEGLVLLDTVLKLTQGIVVALGSALRITSLAVELELISLLSWSEGWLRARLAFEGPISHQECIECLSCSQHPDHQETPVQDPQVQSESCY